MNFLRILREQKSKIKKRRKSSSKIAAGIALITLGLILILGKNKVNRVISTSFEKEPVRIESLSTEVPEEEKIPRRIVIPDLSVDIDVKQANIVAGYWEVFEDTAGWGVGSGIPGETGNQVIFAHAREGLFLPLRSIKVGYYVYVLTDSKWFRYEVKEVKEVYPNQVEVIAPTDDETLTLYTCSGFADTKRLIVVAKKLN